MSLSSRFNRQETGYAVSNRLYHEGKAIALQSGISRLFIGPSSLSEFAGLMQNQHFDSGRLASRKHDF